jgi:5-histidylcysteine sulfoxide synthase/putative 4-mercaptohistidine N1-methyltranferase
MQEPLRNDHSVPLNQYSVRHVEFSRSGPKQISLAARLGAGWWTGVPPTDENCPGLSQDGSMHSLGVPDLRTCTRADVLDYFNNSWTLSELLFSSLVSEESFYIPPVHGLRHPLIFYYLHPPVLYINKLRVAGLLDASINAEYESLFETGVDEMSWDDMSKNAMEWPSFQLLHEYRARVYQAVKRVICTHQSLADGHAPITQNDPIWALFMAVEHERIHLETSSVLIRELPVELVTRPSMWPSFHPAMSERAATHYPPQAGIDYETNELVSITDGDIAIGKSTDDATYGWDNEYGHRSQHVDQFSVSRNLICNGEFWHFVAGGGYQDQKYWSDDGWKWRSFRNAKWPTFWSPDGPAGSHRYRLRTLFENIAMVWSCPVIVNYHEAAAYCRWRSEKDELKDSLHYRLLSEAEHYRLRQVQTPDQNEQCFNNNLRWGAESPVGHDCGSEKAISDLFGNVWQWCDDHFNHLPGFKVHRYYDDFSTPCFDGKHQMIMGGSFISTGDESSQSARFHFRPHFFQHAGFRMVASTGDGGAVKIGGSNKYADIDVLNAYLTLHFAPPEVQMPFDIISREFTGFPQRCADLVTKWADKLAIEPGRALDVGCAVGGASFRLAERFTAVTAIDLSENFINAAKQLQAEGSLDFNCKQEGKITIPVRAKVDKTIATRVTFRQADACSLPADLIDFDAVLLANLLCRLPSPMACLGRMGGARGVVRRGGLLFITTPFTWMEQFTPQDVWLGGFLDDAGNIKLSEEGLEQALTNDFELLDKFNMPLLIREHYRKYELIAALSTVWRRK